MKQAVVTIKYDEEKLNAVKQYMGKKDADFEAELNEVLGKLYEKYVPQAVREQGKCAACHPTGEQVCGEEKCKYRGGIR